MRRRPADAIERQDYSLKQRRISAILETADAACPALKKGPTFFGKILNVQLIFELSIC
jgi:hypothetical protein